MLRVLCGLVLTACLCAQAPTIRLMPTPSGNPAQLTVDTVKIHWADATVTRIAQGDFGGQWSAAPGTGVQVVAVYFKETYQVWQNGALVARPYRKLFVGCDYYWFNWDASFIMLPGPQLDRPFGCGSVNDVPMGVAVSLIGITGGIATALTVHGLNVGDFILVFGTENPAHNTHWTVATAPTATTFTATGLAGLSVGGTVRESLLSAGAIKLGTLIPTEDFRAIYRTAYGDMTP